MRTSCHSLRQPDSFTHICCYLSFLTTNTPRKGINLDVLSTTGHCAYFPDWISPVIEVFTGIFTFWVTKCYKYHISVHIYSFQQQIHQKNGSILMYYPQLDFGASFLGEFHQLLRFYGHFHFLGNKMLYKSHICQYLTFLTTNTPRKWINLDGLCKAGLCG